MSPLARADETPKVTVFLPTWNGGELLEEVLQGLTTQETPWPYEVVAIDSGSKDGTVQRLVRYGVQVTSIPQSEFNHGATRNRAVQAARGEVVVLTVQDATPKASDWLVRMVAPFDDPYVAGVYGHQVPRPDCNPFLKARLRTWLAGGLEPVVHRVSSPEVFWTRLNHIERFQAIAFDNVASAVRKEVLLKLPFPPRRFGEDVTWAKSAILAGHKIVMEPRAAVIHSHDYSVWYEFKRVYMDHQNLNDLVGLTLVPTLRDVVVFSAKSASELAREVWRDASLTPLQRWLWAARAVPFAITQNLAQYLGALSNRCGRRGLWKVWDRIMGHHV